MLFSGNTLLFIQIHITRRWGQPSADNHWVSTLTQILAAAAGSTVDRLESYTQRVSFLKRPNCWTYLLSKRWQNKSESRQESHRHIVGELKYAGQPWIGIEKERKQETDRDTGEEMALEKWTRNLWSDLCLPGNQQLELKHLSVDFKLLVEMWQTEEWVVVQPAEPRVYSVHPPVHFPKGRGAGREWRAEYHWEYPSSCVLWVKVRPQRTKGCWGKLPIIIIIQTKLHISHGCTTTPDGELSI